MQAACLSQFCLYKFPFSFHYNCHLCFPLPTNTCYHLMWELPTTALGCLFFLGCRKGCAEAHEGRGMAQWCIDYKNTICSMGSCQGFPHPPGPHLQQRTTASSWRAAQEKNQGNLKWSFPQYIRSFFRAVCWILTACFRGSLKRTSGARMSRTIGRALGAGEKRWSQEKDNRPRVSVISTQDWQSLYRALSMWGHE